MDTLNLDNNPSRKSEQQSSAKAAPSAKSAPREEHAAPASRKAGKKESDTAANLAAVAGGAAVGIGAAIGVDALANQIDIPEDEIEIIEEGKLHTAGGAHHGGVHSGKAAGTPEDSEIIDDPSSIRLEEEPELPGHPGQAPLSAENSEYPTFDLDPEDIVILDPQDIEIIEIDDPTLPGGSLLADNFDIEEVLTAEDMLDPGYDIAEADTSGYTDDIDPIGDMFDA